MREIKTCPGQEWKQLPTEELDKILQAELEKEHPDEEVVLPILQILEEREEDYPAEETPEALAILEKLNNSTTPSEQPKKRRGLVAGIAAVAAAACVVVMVLPRTVGAESIFDVLFRWTKSVFEFIDPDENESYPNVGNVFVTDNPGLQQLYDKVTELGVTDPVVPMWLPEGFELESLKEYDQRVDGNKIYAVFQKDESSISFSYRISSNITTKFEKKNSTVEMFEAGGVSHVVLENAEKLSVTWMIEGVECSMHTNVEKANVYTIIMSIYRSELPQ
ncbi:MAG: DUF4367 domain-containing protein [Oscillospiraceae bacterium]|nr:DUF4367 domain-containing protein [Oscillospiraceae bacterium]